MKRFVDLLCLLIFIFLCASSVLFPGYLSKHVLNAVFICFNTVIPVLFPFIVISRILSETTLLTRAGRILGPVISFVFGVDKNLCGSFLLGLFGGFPSGAISTGIIYNKGCCSKESAERNLALCNNTSLSFISAIAGSVVLGSLKNGIILIFAQLLTIFFTSIILRIIYKTESNNIYINNTKLSGENKRKISIIKILKQSTLNMLYISGLITVFCSLAGVISEMCGNKFHLVYIIKSLFEVTGAVDVCKYASFPLNIVLCSISLGFSGLCVMFQISDICEEYGLSPKYFIISRIISGIFMPTFTVILLLIAPRDAISVFNDTFPVNESVVNLGAITLIYAVVLVLVMLIFGILYYIATLFEKKEYLNKY